MKSIQNLQTSQDYIFHISQCFATKLHNVIKYRMLFSAVLMNTQQKTHNLFWPDENRIEQCFAAHIVQGCQQYRTLVFLRK